MATVTSEDVKDWLEDGLGEDWPKVRFEVGIDPPKRWGSMTNGLVLVAPWNGPGLHSEYLMDSKAWYVQILGPQFRDPRWNTAFQATELLANAVDEYFIFQPAGSVVINGINIKRIQRFGSLGTPTAIGGASERAPWTATYVTDVPTALAQNGGL